MTDAIIDRLRQRFETRRVACLRDAIDVFEESYRQDRADSDDSLIIVGWPKPDAAAYDLALGRCLRGGPNELPAIVTAGLLIPMAAGDSLPTEVDEELKQLEWQPGNISLQCNSGADADVYFAKVRNLAVVRKYGEAVPISCKLDIRSDEKRAEIASKIADYFAEHGWPYEDDSSGGKRL